MRISLSVDEVKKAVAEYINGHKMVCATVKPEDVQVQMERVGQYDGSEDIFTGIYVDLKPN